VSVVAALLFGMAWTPPSCPFHSKPQLDACARHDFVIANREMTAAWKRNLQRWKAVDPRSTSAIGPRGFQELVVEQKAWEAWRNAHCAVEAQGLENTSVDRSVRLDCMSRMTHDRIKQIEEMGPA